MTINPLHFNGMMQRSQDVSSVKQNEEQRPVMQQENIQTSFQRKMDDAVRTVVNPEKGQQANGHFDAKEEGKNKYFNTRKKDEKPKPKDQVTEKKQTYGFDVTV